MQNILVCLELCNVKRISGRNITKNKKLKKKKKEEREQKKKPEGEKEKSAPETRKAKDLLNRL